MVPATSSSSKWLVHTSTHHMPPFIVIALNIDWHFLCNPRTLTPFSFALSPHLCFLMFPISMNKEVFSLPGLGYTSVGFSFKLFHHSSLNCKLVGCPRLHTHLAPMAPSLTFFYISWTYSLCWPILGSYFVFFFLLF